jgi:DDE superfamily endonuclease/Helix-turn-helix of DDE superfamily endonuclease
MAKVKLSVERHTPTLERQAKKHAYEAAEALLVLPLGNSTNIQCFNNQTANTSPVDMGEGNSTITSPVDMGEGNSTITSPVDMGEGSSNIQCFNNQTNHTSPVDMGKDIANIQTINTSQLAISHQYAKDSTKTITSSIGVNIDSLFFEMQQLRCENYLLREKVLCFELTPESFINDDDKVKFYTGIHSYGVLMLIFNSSSGTINHNHNNCLTKFQEFVLTLMKLRLSLPLRDLSYRFKISLSTASRIFEKWVRHMAHNLRQFIVWPEREDIQKTMPNCFKRSFGANTAVIIDCFEIFIDRPSSLAARAITWSQYKHNNTIKFLIGITPQCTISFISKAWGGRVSDKYLTENCGILNKLSTGDLVLADRGFTIADSVGLYCAKLAIPAFTKGKKQLSALEVAETRKIANVRIHVERVIGSVRQKYKILSDTLPLDYLNEKGNPLIDDIVTTCCALINLCPAIVPFD